MVPGVSPTNTTRTVVERRPFGPTISEPAAALRTELPQLTPRFSTIGERPAAPEPATPANTEPVALASPSFLPELPVTTVPASTADVLPHLPVAR
jgi:hypothetical protein